MIKLYDLAAADERRRFSPYCWRTKMALAHKGLEVETIPWHFTDKAAIAFVNSERVPVIVDGERAVADSWDIARYLEAYPERRSLFGATGPAPARFMNSWVDTVVNALIAPLVMRDVLDHLADADREYFRQSREARFKLTIEDFCANYEQNLTALRRALEPVRQTLRSHPYLGGEEPLYPDYILFGTLQWPRAIAPQSLLEASDPINQWRERLLIVSTVWR
ncbi:MAG: glutathione S-transferase family protein, partial [Candidatus Binataceae bacterium]